MYRPRFIYPLLIAMIILAGCSGILSTGASSEATPVVSTAKSASQVELSLKLPGKEYEVDKDYIFEVTLKNTSVRGEVLSSAAGMGGMFEIVALDASNQPASLKKETIEAISQGEKYDLMNEMQRVTFKEPGEYKIYCRLNNSEFQTTSDAADRMESYPLELKTEPVVVTVRQAN